MLIPRKSGAVVPSILSAIALMLGASSAAAAVTEGHGLAFSQRDLNSAAVASATAPSGPRLAVVRASSKAGLELVTIGPRGGRPLRLAGGGRSRPLIDFFYPISWSPDGERIAFSAIVGFRNGDGAEPITKLFTVQSDGTDLRAIRGSKGGTGPVFSPDGHTVAFTRSIDRPEPTTVDGKVWDEGFQGSTIWTIDLVTAAQRRLTPWHHELFFDPSSFSPDGSTLLATLDDGRFTNEPQPVTLQLDGGGLRRILDDGWYPTYSPDGSKIALARRVEEYGRDGGEDLDLYVVNADGSGLRRLTRTPGREELYPSWDPSGERLAYVRLPLVRSEDAPFGYGNALMEINVDGSCQIRVPAVRPSLFFTPAWQPGADRGAGRIEC